MIETELPEFLKANADIAALATGGVWLGALPENKTYPALLCVGPVSYTPQPLLDGTPKVEARWTFVAYSQDTPTAAIELRRAVIAALTRFSGELTSGGTAIETGDPEDARPVVFEYDLGVWTTEVDFVLLHHDQ